MTNMGDESRIARLKSRHLISLADPGRYSPQERQGLEKFAQEVYEKPALREHELAMLRQQGQNDVEKERVIASGKLAENRSRFGFFDKKGVYHGGSDVAAAQASGLSKLETQMLNNQGKLDVAEANNRGRAEIAAQNNETRENIAAQNNETRAEIAEKGNATKKAISEKRRQNELTIAEGRNAATVEAARVRTDNAEQVAFERWLAQVNNFQNDAVSPKKLKGMTTEEIKALWRKSVGR